MSVFCQLSHDLKQTQKNKMFLSISNILKLATFIQYKEKEREKRWKGAIVERESWKFLVRTITKNILLYCEQLQTFEKISKNCCSLLPFSRRSFHWTWVFQRVSFHAVSFLPFAFSVRRMEEKAILTHIWIYRIQY